MRFKIGDRVRYRGNLGTVRNILLPKSYDIVLDNGEEWAVHDDDVELVSA